MTTLLPKGLPIQQPMTPSSAGKRHRVIVLNEANVRSSTPGWSTIGGFSLAGILSSRPMTIHSGLQSP
ncbi:hypothetical protein LXL04_006617 [Taraxacum kok-saghyz]